MPAVLGKSRESTSRLRGLTEGDVAERRAWGDINVVPRTASRTYGRVVSQNLLTFLNLLIFGVSAVLAVLGLYVDALLAGVLGIVNASVAIV